MNLNEIAKWRKREGQKQELESLLPDLKKAYLRLQLNPLTLPELLKNYSPEYLAEYMAPILEPPASPEEAKIQMLADLVISLLYPGKKIDLIIDEALPEIEKAYNVVLRRGGGWSFESNPDKRKTAVLEWYQRSQPRLSYLKEAYLQDLALYEDGGGQEKRNFITRLLLKIVKDKANKELNFQKVDAHLKTLKKLKQRLRLEEL
jgi:hypothetical protein